jgi:hypothetical protein
VISAFGIAQCADPVVDRRFPAGYGEPGSACATTGCRIHFGGIAARPSRRPAGLVLVEIYYDYHMVLGLPWITAFVPNPIPLHAYTIMPNSSVEPTATP